MAIGEAPYQAEDSPLIVPSTGFSAPVAAPTGTGLLAWNPTTSGLVVVSCAGQDDVNLEVWNTDTATDATFLVYGSQSGRRWGIVPIARADGVVSATYVVTAQTATHGQVSFWMVAGNWNFLTLIPISGTLTTGALFAQKYGLGI